MEGNKGREALAFLPASSYWILVPKQNGKFAETFHLLLQLNNNRLKVVGSNLHVTSLNPLKSYGLPFLDLTIKYDLVFCAIVIKVL